MPKAETIHIPSRRAMLADLPLAAAAAPDAELIALCQEFISLERKSNAAWDAAEEAGACLELQQEEHSTFLEKQRPLLKKIVALRASTPAGFEARTNMMLGWFTSFWEEILVEEIDIENHGNWRSIMLKAFMRDAIGHDPILVHHDLVGGLA